MTRLTKHIAPLPTGEGQGWGYNPSITVYATINPNRNP